MIKSGFLASLFLFGNMIFILRFLFTFITYDPKKWNLHVEISEYQFFSPFLLSWAAATTIRVFFFKKRFPMTPYTFLPSFSSFPLFSILPLPLPLISGPLLPAPQGLIVPRSARRVRCQSTYQCCIALNLPCKGWSPQAKGSWFRAATIAHTHALAHTEALDLRRCSCPFVLDGRFVSDLFFRFFSWVYLRERVWERFFVLLSFSLSVLDMTEEGREAEKERDSENPRVR